MKCHDCVEKKAHTPTTPIKEAEYVHIEGDRLRFVCEESHHEYVQAYGETAMELESFHLEKELEQALIGIAEAFKGKVKQYRWALDENSKLRKTQSSTSELTREEAELLLSTKCEKDANGRHSWEKLGVISDAAENRYLIWLCAQCWKCVSETLVFLQRKEPPQ